MKAICQNFGTELGSTEEPSAPSDWSDSECRLLSLAEIAYSGWSFASLTLLRKVEEEPQLLVVFVVTTAAAIALEEEHMACLDQQYSENEGQAVVVVEDLSISDLDDSSNLDCIYCLKGHNYSTVVGFVAEGVYYKCLHHKLQVAH